MCCIKQRFDPRSLAGDTREWRENGQTHVQKSWDQVSQECPDGEEPVEQQPGTSACSLCTAHEEGLANLSRRFL